MHIYKYMIKKYAKQPSTWVITLISLFIIVFIGGYVPFSVGGKYIDSARGYVKLEYFLIAGISTFLAIFISVFSAFKASKMFRDEIEDGSFLLIISKPISRTKILLFKWLALTTYIVLYSLLVSMFFGLMVKIFDIGPDIADLEYVGAQTLSSHIFIISIYIWITMLTLGIIFSSIALLFSTRLATGAVIGISTALAILVPITGLISTFTAKSEYRPATTIRRDERILSLLDSLSSYEAKNKMPIVQEIVSQKLNDLRKDIKKYDKDPNNIYSLVAGANRENSFRNLWPIDLDFQIRTLSEFATEEVVNPSLLAYVLEDSGRFSSSFKYTVDNSTRINNQAEFDEFLNKGLSARLDITWKTFDMANLLFKNMKIQYKDNKGNIFSMSIKDAINLHLKESSKENWWSKRFLHAIHRIEKYKNATSITDAMLKDIDTGIDMLKNQREVKNAKAITIGEELLSYIFDVSRGVTASDEEEVLLNNVQWLVWGEHSLLKNTTYPNEIKKTLESNKIKIVKATPAVNGSFALALFAQDEFSKDIYNKYVSIINNGVFVGKAKGEKYVKKENLLIGYYVIGIILVLVSWVIVSRENFK